MKRIGISTVGYCLVCCQLLAAQIVRYPVPENMARNDDFTVMVRTPGGGWQEISSYRVAVDAVIGTKHTPQNSSLAYFDFNGTVDVSITFNRGSIQSARVRPLSYGIIPKVSGNTLTF